MTMDLQHRIYNLLNRDRKGMVASRIYDWYMLVMILGSLVPLMFVRSYPVFTYIEAITVGAFIVDYLMRWYSSPLQLKEGWISYLKYPFTPMAIIDLLTILSGMDLISAEFKILRLTRLLRLVALLKIFRYSSKFAIFIRVLKQEKDVLLGVVGIAVFYIFVSALIMFNAEPHIHPETGNVTFGSFFDALYWATVTLTTVGYGDLRPTTEVGRIVSMMSSLFGVGIIAMPSGVITAGYMQEWRRSHESDADTDAGGKSSDTASGHDHE